MPTSGIGLICRVSRIRRQRQHVPRMLASRCSPTRLMSLSADRRRQSITGCIRRRSRPPPSATRRWAPPPAGYPPPPAGYAGARRPGGCTWPVLRPITLEAAGPAAATPRVRADDLAVPPRVPGRRADRRDPRARQAGPRADLAAPDVTRTSPLPSRPRSTSPARSYGSIPSAISATECRWVRSCLYIHVSPEQPVARRPGRRARAIPRLQGDRPTPASPSTRNSASSTRRCERRRVSNAGSSDRDIIVLLNLNIGWSF